MRHNKLGAFFLVSTLALAGVGVSYAGFTDYIKIHGEIECATVSLEVVDFSCTVIYKIWCLEEKYWGIFQEEAPDGWHTDFENEVAQYHGFYDYETYGGRDIPPIDIMSAFVEFILAFEDEYTVNVCYEYVSFAKAMPCAHDPTVEKEIDMQFDNVFPCKDFIADFVFHYTGSIPGRINRFFFLHASSTFVNMVEYEFYTIEPILGSDKEIIGWETPRLIPNFMNYQLHYCDYILVKVIVHLDQDNSLQGLRGIFGGRIEVIQWYDPVV